MKLSLKIDEANNTVAPYVNYSNGDDLTPLPVKNAGKLYEQIVPSTNVDLGILPPAIRWISSDQRVVVFERPPSVQYVEFALDIRDRINTNTTMVHFNLPMPWTIYYVLFDENYSPVTIRVYCRNEPIYSWDDEMYMLPMLNLYYDSTLCNPIYEKFELAENLSEGIQQAYNMVWNSGWNLDLKDTVTHCMKEGVPTGLSGLDNLKSIVNYLKSWEKMSILEILSTRWVQPKAYPNGTPFEVEDGEVPNTFRNTLDHFNNTVVTVNGMTVREAMVKIINSLSVI